MMPKLIAFDLDGTLAQSKRAITREMAQALSDLLATTRVAITSGGMLSQLQTQVVDELHPQANLHNLYLLPTSGGALYTYEAGTWQIVYEELLTHEESEHITRMLEEGAESTGLIDFSTKAYGERIEERGPQVSLSALGQTNVPIEEKKAWDPTRKKRETLRDAISKLLPEYDVKIGGISTIDVTKKGVNKAFCIRELSKYLNIPITEMLYLGDELSEGGNDSVVKETGIKTIPVTDPSDTLAHIQNVLKEA